MTSILLSSGRRVDPFNLDGVKLTLDELIPPLAKLCRYTGHTRGHFSVAEHEVHLINKVPAGLKRAAALHDLNESLTNDLPHPFKAKLPDYVGFEIHVQQHIFRQFDEPWENMALLSQYDRRICADEMQQVFAVPFQLEGVEPLGGVNVEFWEWREAEQKLRQSFKFLGLL
jgi:hypothetical protein